ncbi:hypothetical protein LCGC14_0679130 [marine sediment metagenome]|uniref:Uncharacterized protein n=1 Tax=marine sediment metagenome TaxID=412755 RepID=A0A0F9QTU6_9ZZZZ|nr:MAG: hypothetical protein Lokiarch_33380 [Candidatus Lokiarchaeum sp. GC14_75]
MIKTLYFKRIKASNFKSFKELDINLDKFNTIIGPNASGKSNFLSIIRFFKDIVAYGLGNAFSLHGTINNVKNIALNQKDIKFEISLGNETAYIVSSFEKDKQRYGFKIKDSDYSLTIEAGKNHRDFKITHEEYRNHVQIYKLKRDEKKEKFIEIKETIQEGFITIIKKNGKLIFEKEPEDLPIEREQVIYDKGLLINEYGGDIFKDKILLNHPFILTGYYIEVQTFFEGISVYDIDPKLPKRAIPFTGRQELEENGRNIAIVLNNIYQDKKEQEKFNKLLKDLLPFVEDLKVDRLRDESFITCLRECYHDHYFPAYLLSDGTINIVALIVILFFEEKSVIVIEEPDRNLHPLLLSRIIYMMEDVSKTLGKQIIITTHNPEIVRYVDQKKVITIDRNKAGFSQMSKPSEKAELAVFLKDMGIADLFLEGIL